MTMKEFQALYYIMYVDSLERAKSTDGQPTMDEMVEEIEDEL